MCGLVGMAGVALSQDLKMLKYLLWFDTSRGEDSTGLAVIGEKDNAIMVHKKVGLPSELFNTKVFDHKYVYDGPKGKAFIGHNRAATKGLVTDENAHPFHHGDIVGAHNGTLVSVWGLEDGDKFEVDSEAIFYNLSKYAIRNTIAKVNGAYALTWYDKLDDKLYVIRNSQRPLYWARRKDREVIYWASEPWMLVVAALKSNVTITEPEAFEVNRLYELNLGFADAAKFRATNWAISADVVEGYKYVAPVKPKITYTNIGGGKGSNVLPFVGSSNVFNQSSMAVSKEELAKMKLLQGKTMTFRFKSVRKGVSGSFYLSAAQLDTNENLDVRIYADRHANWGKWCAEIGKQTYTATVKRVVQQHHANKENEAYFLIDLRTITEVEDKELPLPESNTTSDVVVVTPPVKTAETTAKQDAKAKKDKKTNSNLTPLQKDELGDTDFYAGFMGRWLSADEWKIVTKNGCACCSEPPNDHDADLTFIQHDEFLCGTCVEAFPEYVTNKKLN